MLILNLILTTATKELEDDFKFLKEKWICRSVVEIALLILRCHEKEKEKADEKSSTRNRYLPRITLEQQSLGNFLDTLKIRKTWQTEGRTQKKVPPCVPTAVCFDETSQAVGASRPSWDVGKKTTWNPWVFGGKTDFFTASRDSRIPPQIREHHFQPAKDIFDRLALFKNIFDEKDPATPQRRLDLRAQFGREYFGPLRRYEQHVQQAINGHTGEFIDPCVRCSVYWNAVLLQPRGTQVTSTDTESTDRPIGACAEHCVHAELVMQPRAARCLRFGEMILEDG
ncbi:hypothetical protein EV356DRAFT_74999 [Viridothelium virens]|uniref:Uncharacterized protein n=1 Tax=Viridothelium virens TaxID=1048519 RepID=A0A6A6HDK9_VIRVR|nr:hypothetical protein EV356DRAFT_74999 [Viridothelium virens]